jgi:hypothetical protein
MSEVSNAFFQHVRLTTQHSDIDTGEEGYSVRPLFSRI